MNSEIINLHTEYISNLVSSNIFNASPSKYYLTSFEHRSDSLFKEIDLPNLEIKYSISDDYGVVLQKENYKTFVVNNKICIGFFHISNYPKYSVVISYGDQKETVQLQAYENVDRYLRMGRDHQWGAFVFLDSCPAVDASPVYDGGPQRCDLKNYGPHGWGQSGSSSGTHSMDIGNRNVSVLGPLFAEFDHIFNVEKYGHICYIRMRDLNWGNNNIYGMEVPFVGRTLSEIFKIVIEWAEVTKSPWDNTQDIAIKAKGFLEGLDIPSDIYTSLSENQADMHTFRYLNGYTDARSRPELSDIKNFDQIVIDWMKTKFTYSDFANMINLNPRLSSI